MATYRSQVSMHVMHMMRTVVHMPAERAHQTCKSGEGNQPKNFNSSADARAQIEKQTGQGSLGRVQ